MKCWQLLQKCRDSDCCDFQSELSEVNRSWGVRSLRGSPAGDGVSVHWVAEVLRMELICLGSSEKNFLIIFLYSPLNSSFMQSFDYQRMQIFIQALLEENTILVQNSEILLYSECSFAPWKFLGGVREPGASACRLCSQQHPVLSCVLLAGSFTPLLSASWWVCAGCRWGLAFVHRTSVVSNNTPCPFGTSLCRLVLLL